jgi:hypothetical protein
VFSASTVVLVTGLAVFVTLLVSRLIDHLVARRLKGSGDTYVPVLVRDDKGYIYDLADRVPVEGDTLLYVQSSD